jgi:hypothetical protein
VFRDARGGHFYLQGLFDEHRVCPLSLWERAGVRVYDFNPGIGVSARLFTLAERVPGQG